MLIATAEGWRFQGFRDGSAALYHPYSGQLHALSLAGSCLFSAASDASPDQDAFLASAAEACRAAGLVVEESLLAQHLDQLVALGILVARDD